MPCFACPCCGDPTLDEEPPGTYAICAVCFREDDPVQFDDPSFAGGANELSLAEARVSYERNGACEARGLEHVRPPAQAEQAGRVMRSCP